MSKISILTKADIPGMLSLLDNAFPADEPFVTTWTHTCTPAPKDYKEHILIKDGEFVASHIGIYSLACKVDGALLKIGGIGAVSTHEKYRGKGHMNDLLLKASELLKERKFDISWLGGDRKRYGNFGWENGGRVCKFIITSRYLGKCGEYSFRLYKGEKALLNTLAELHSGEAFGLKRDNNLNRKLFGRRKRNTFLAFSGKQAAAYITLGVKGDQAQARMLEYGGSFDGIAALMKYAFETLKYERLEAVTPSAAGKYKTFFTDNSSQWQYDHNGDGMIKIIDLFSMLKKFEKQLNLKARASGLNGKHAVTLIMEGTGQKATIEAGKQVRITSKDAKVKIVLNEREMVRLLFPLSVPSDWIELPKGAGFLDLLFPLDFFLWPLEVI